MCSYMRVFTVLAGWEHAIFAHRRAIAFYKHINLRSHFHVEFVTEKTLSGQFAKEIL